MNIFNLIHWQIFFAGLWGELWAQTWPVVAIIVLVGAAIASEFVPVLGPYLNKIRVLCLGLAALIGIYFVGQTRGIMIADAKWQARAAVVKKVVDDKVKTSPLDDHNWTDPFNSKDN